MTLVVRDANRRRLGTVCVTGGKLAGSNPGVHDLVAAAVRRSGGAPAAVRDLANFSNGYITIRNESAPPKTLDNAAVHLSAQTPVLSAVHHPLGSPAGPGLFRVKGLQLPAYIQNIAHALERNGHPESQAIQLAIGACQRWARGGGKVSPEVRAAAAKALAEWEAAKAAAHSHSNDPEDAVTVELAGAFNSALHPRVGAGSTGGGRFAAKNASAAPAAGKQAQSGRPGRPSQPVTGRRAQVRQLRERASALRGQAGILDQQAHALAAAHPASKAASKVAKKAAATRAKKNLPVRHRTKTSARKTKPKASVASRITSLRSRARILRTRARLLDIKAREIALAGAGPAVELSVMTPAPQRAAGRRKLAAEDKALPDGTDPIPNLDYLKRAIKSVGRVDPSKRPALKALIRKRARELGALGAPGVKGTWAFEAANDAAGVELATLTTTPKVRGAGDVQCSRTAPGNVTVMHKPTGMKVGTLTKGPGGWVAAHSTGRTMDPAPSMAASLSGLIGLHNRVAKSVPPMTPAGKTRSLASEFDARRAADVAAMRASVNLADGEQMALDLAGVMPGSTPAVSSSDGPRVTKMAGGKMAKTAPKAGAASMSAEVAKVYRKLIARGMKPAQAMALAKRAAAMHAKASAKAA